MDIIKLLEQAMVEEKAAGDLYRGLATAADDPEGKAIFTAMARDEEKHYQVLRERLTAIKLRRPAGSSSG